MAVSMTGKLRASLIIGVIVLVLVGGGIGLRYWYLAANYVNTDNAQIEAALVQVGPLNTGQLVTLDVDIGSFVSAGQRVGVIEMPSTVSTSGQTGFPGYPSRMADITATVSGYVAAIWAQPGSIIGPGQPIVTLYDPSNIWVTANIKETAVDRVRPGESAEISIDMLGGKKLQGTVVGIASATAATFSLLPQQNTTGNYTKVVQVVPVKIAFNQRPGSQLIPGSSVGVSISTR